MGHDQNDESQAFLCPSINYILPKFSTNSLDEDLFITLSAKNVAPSSLTVLRPEGGDNACMHIKFFSTACPPAAPSYFAFYIRFPKSSILQHSVESWDNNVVIELRMKNPHAEFEFGLSPHSTTPWFKEPIVKDSPLETTPYKATTVENPESYTLCQVHSGSDQAILIELSKSRKPEPNKIPPAQHRERKKSKGRSLSESHCDAISSTCEILPRNLSQLPKSKERSVSESSGGESFQFKSILKNQLTRSISESYSSVDEQSLSSLITSLEGVGFRGIPEEEDTEGATVRKVTFSDVIKKQLFRSDASIVGRRLKNMKKAAKKRAERQRLSESENSEPEDKKNSNLDRVGRRDSGVEFSDECWTEEPTLSRLKMVA